METRSHQNARFFKITLPNTIAPHKLRIPSKFVDKYGDELSNVVKLIDLVGATWYVKLETAEKTVWFNDGWKKFVDGHSIGLFYFLLFEYIGNSSFNVHIFNSTAIEVNCPSNHRILKLGEDIKMEENSDDDSVQMIDSPAPKPNGKLQHKLPSFRARLKDYNVVTRKLPLYVPVKIAKHLPSVPHHFEVHDADGKRWPFDVIRKDNKKVYFGGEGWKKLVEEKGLKIGDTCVFELIDANNWMLKVLTRRQAAN